MFPFSHLPFLQKKTKKRKLVRERQKHKRFVGPGGLPTAYTPVKGSERKPLKTSKQRRETIPQALSSKRQPDEMVSPSLCSTSFYLWFSFPCGFLSFLSCHHHSFSSPLKKGKRRWQKRKDHPQGRNPQVREMSMTTSKITCKSLGSWKSLTYSRNSGFPSGGFSLSLPFGCLCQRI